MAEVDQHQYVVCDDDWRLYLLAAWHPSLELTLTILHHATVEWEADPSDQR